MTGAATSLSRDKVARKFAYRLAFKPVNTFYWSPCAAEIA
jgi:hypothetical protein